jgi:hypothetical protein
VIKNIYFSEDTLATLDDIGRKTVYPLSSYIRTLDSPVVNAFGTPVLPVSATLTTDFTDPDGDLTFTATTAGVEGDNIEVQFIAPDLDGSPLEVIIDKEIVLFYLEGATDGVASAVEYGSGNGKLTITALLGGSYYNDFSLEVIAPTKADEALSAKMELDTIVVSLGTNAQGEVDNNKNTATLVAAAINAIDDVEFSAVAGGNGEDPVIATAEPVAFADGTDPTIVTTAEDIESALTAWIADPENDGYDPLVSITQEGSGKGLVEPFVGTLDGGEDGSVARKGSIMFDEDFLYVAVDDSTVSTSGWKCVALSDIGDVEE